MKILNSKLFYAFVLILILSVSCGSSSSNLGGTETGSTDSGSTVNTATLSANLENVASALVPQISTQTNSSINNLSYAITYGDTNDWSTYLSDDNATVITDVFGPASEAPAVVTKIRVLLDQFGNTLDNLFSGDTSLDCTGGTALTEGDTIEIAFFGNVSNGTSDNRFFDCVNDSDSTQTIVYGQDSSGALHVAVMANNTSVNTESTTTRGDTNQISSVIMGVYAEASTGSGAVAYLDLQYTQSTSYNGVDDTFGTNDDVIFKSRTRITGAATLDSDGNPSDATGDFAVTKFDQGVNNDSSTFTITTQSVGRGNHGNGEYSLFDIQSDNSNLNTLPNDFCIQHSDGTLPSFADASNCTALETATTFNVNDFPFTLTPALEQNFEDVEYFQSNDTDMIASDSSNFTIPSYTTTN